MADRTIQYILKAKDETKDAFKSMSKGAGGAATAIATIGAAIIATTTAVVAFTTKMASLNDALSKQAMKVGLTVQGYEDLSFVFNQMSDSADALPGSIAKIQMAMTKMDVEGAKANKSFRELGISLTDTNGKTKSSSQVFQESIIKLSSVKNETERTRIANQLFGKSYQELIPLINSGKDALIETFNAAEDYRTVTDSMVKASEKLGDTQDKLGLRWKQTLNIFAEPIMSPITKIMEKLDGMLKSIQPQLRDLVTTFVDVGKILGSNFSIDVKPLQIAITIINNLVVEIAIVIQTIISAFDYLATAIAAAMAGLVNFVNKTKEIRSVIEEDLIKTTNSFIGQEIGKQEQRLKVVEDKLNKLKSDPSWWGDDGKKKKDKEIKDLTESSNKIKALINELELGKLVVKEKVKETYIDIGALFTQAYGNYNQKLADLIKKFRTFDYTQTTPSTSTSTGVKLGGGNIGADMSEYTNKTGDMTGPYSAYLAEIKKVNEAWNLSLIQAFQDVAKADEDYATKVANKASMSRAYDDAIAESWKKVREKQKKEDEAYFANEDKLFADSLSKVNTYTQAFANMANNTISTITEISNTVAQNDMNKAKKEYQAKKDLLDATVMGSRKRAREEAKIEKEKDDKLKKIQEEQFKRQKALSIASALINGAVAAIQAYQSMLVIPVGGVALGAVAASVVTAFTIAQVASIASQEFSYTNGGIVPGNSTTGDRLKANVNSKEMILNPQQQANLFALANNGGAGNGKAINMDMSTTINGNVDSNTLDKLNERDVRNQEAMKRILRQMSFNGTISKGVLV
jgi:hypothetical protein